MLPYMCALSVAPLVGLARAALEHFSEQIHQRPITYTFYDRQDTAAVTHLQLAECTLKLECAEHLAHELVSLVGTKTASGAAYTAAESARARGLVGYVGRLARDIADITGMASGGSSLRLSSPSQRIVRDIGAFNLHSLLAPTTNLELYGRVLAGLEPNSPFM
jgi:hypothetical protein